MSTKTSSLNMSANNSPTSPAMSSAAASANTTPTVVKIKKELPSDEIKEFAESTMNELLGWYGFDNVDRMDISAKTSKLLQSAALINSQQQQHHQEQLKRRRNRNNRANALLQMHQQQKNEHLRSSLTTNNSSSGGGSSNNITNNNNSVINNNNNSARNNTATNNSNYRSNDSTTSDHDTRSSRDDDSKSPHSTGILSTTAASTMDEKLDFQNCCWCRRPVPENAPEFLTSTDGPRYCSESCFTQSRRASFKKAKTCDWCKHIRHAVSYVDFNDGATQLQFCSDKCLNQYKMQIFCKETQAHLDMNPHLKEQGLDAANNGANLITPDMWLKNCRSRSASPESTVSTSPGPNCGATSVIERFASSTPLSPPKITTTSNTQNSTNTTTYKPMISVAPVSKLMSKSPGIMSSRQSPKHNRKKRPLKSCAPADMTNNRGETKANCVPGSAANKPKSLIASLAESSNRPSLNQTNPPSLNQFAASCVQDLHMNVPPLSPMLDSPASQPTTPHNLPPNSGRGSSTMPPAFFSTPPNAAHQAQPPPIAPPGNYPPRPPFMHNPAAAGFFPRFLGNFAGLPPPTNALMPPDLPALNALIGTPPPVTVMVPYPIIIPLPIPIPVPLPIVDFYKAYLTPEERRKYEETQRIKRESETTLNNRSNSTERSSLAAEEPLDFTKTKDVEEFSSEIQETSDKVEFIAKEEEAETSHTTSTTPSDDAPPTPKILHCVISTDETLPENENSNMKATIASSSQDFNDESNEENNQKLPKLKITRLQTKRTLIQTKESECSRPLRKRKRIIDCDFQKIAANSSREMDDELQQQQTTEMVSNKGQNNK